MTLATKPAAHVSRDLERSVGFLLHDVARLMRRQFMRRAQDLGLTQVQAQALAYIARYEGVRQNILADMLEIQPVSLVRLIDRMAAQGWVERRPDPTDRRAQNLYLTPASEPILDKMWALSAELREEVMGDMPPALREQLVEALLHVRRNLVSGEAAAGSRADA